jgi:hypothetical protein
MNLHYKVQDAKVGCGKAAIKADWSMDCCSTCAGGGLCPDTSNKILRSWGVTQETGNGK